MATIELKSTSGAVLFTCEAETLKGAVEAAMRARVSLAGAYLSDADLTDADLTGADLTDADLTGADLTDADLTGAVGVEQLTKVQP